MRAPLLSFSLAGWLPVLLLSLVSACQPHHPDSIPAGTSPSPSQTSMPPNYSDRFELSASPGCADGYPATIDEARFISSNGGSSFPVPNGHFLNSGWGGSAIGWSVGNPMQPVPDSLEIRWFSYTEDKFYEGHFLLPQEKIYALLQRGLWNADNRQQVTYNDLSLSVVPGGVVVVWLTKGGSERVLIGRYQAREIAYDYALHRPKVDRAGDVADTRAKLTPEVQREIATHMISSQKWDAWLKRYPWQLEFSQPLTITKFGIGYFNAEASYFPPTPDSTVYFQQFLTPGSKPVPQYWMLYVAGAYGRKRLFKVDPFDEQETMAAFQTLAAKHPGQPLTLFLDTDERLSRAALSLRAGADVVPLTKSNVQLFDLP